MASNKKTSKKSKVQPKPRPRSRKSLPSPVLAINPKTNKIEVVDSKIEAVKSAFLNAKQEFIEELPKTIPQNKWTLLVVKAVNVLSRIWSVVTYPFTDRT